MLIGDSTFCRLGEFEDSDVSAIPETLIYKTPLNQETDPVVPSSALSFLAGQASAQAKDCYYRQNPHL